MMMRPYLTLCRTYGPILVIPNRGSKQKWGGITRDPYKTFQHKLNRKQQENHGKLPLKSEERAQRDLLYPLNVQSLEQYISEYVPLEKFAKAPFYTKVGRSQRWKTFKENLQIIYGGAMIRRKLKKTDPFQPIKFARWAQETFIEVNHGLQIKDKEVLKRCCTETASESLRKEIRNKMYKWNFIGEIERPRIVNARVAPLLNKDNLYGQVIVRLYSKQIMTVHSLSGQLLLGHPSDPKSVLDYIVFERPLIKEDSTWRICGKIRPQKPYHKTIKKNAI